MKNIKHLILFLVGFCSYITIEVLFKGYLWNRIPRKDRLLLGTLFLNWIQQNSNIAKPINKTSSGQQKYQKI